MQNKNEVNSALVQLQKYYKPEFPETFILKQKKIVNPAMAEAVRLFLESHPNIKRLEFPGTYINNDSICILVPSLEKFSLTMINFSNSKITDEIIISLGDILKNYTALTHLNLSTNSISDQGAAVLAESLTNKQELIELNLIKNNITAKGTLSLSNAFSNNVYIHLKLSKNPIGSKGAEILCGDLKKKIISDLRLENNHIDDVGIVALSQSFQQHPTISKLILSNNRIGQEGAKGLKLVLENNPYIRYLDLSGNKLSEPEALILAGGFALNRKLVILNLSFNPQMGVKGIGEIIAAFINHPNLRKFYCMANNIGDEGAVSISNLITYNKVLTYLDLDSNSIGISGGEFIAQALKGNQFIKGLVLSRNPIGDNGAVAFSSALRKHLYIKSLSLKNTEITTFGVLALASALKENETLTYFELDLTCSTNIAEIEGPQALIDVLKTNHNLIKFEFRCKTISESLQNEMRGLVSKNQQLMRQKHANQFTYAILILARATLKPYMAGYWSLLTPELKNKVIDFLCLSLSYTEQFGKSYKQFQQCNKFIFDHIEEINQRIQAESPIKILENIPKVGNSIFTFFKPPLKRSLEEATATEAGLKNDIENSEHKIKKIIPTNNFIK